MLRLSVGLSKKKQEEHDLRRFLATAVQRGHLFAVYWGYGDQVNGRPSTFPTLEAAREHQGVMLRNIARSSGDVSYRRGAVWIRVFRDGQWLDVEHSTQSFELGSSEFASLER